MTKMIFNLEGSLRGYDHVLEFHKTEDGEIYMINAVNDHSFPLEKLSGAIIYEAAHNLANLINLELESKSKDDEFKAITDFQVRAKINDFSISFRLGIEKLKSPVAGFEFFVTSVLVPSREGNSYFCSACDRDLYDCLQATLWQYLNTQCFGDNYKLNNAINELINELQGIEYIPLSDDDIPF